MWSEPTPAVTHSLRFLAFQEKSLAEEVLMHRATYLLYKLASEIARMERSSYEDFGLDSESNVTKYRKGWYN